MHPVFAEVWSTRKAGIPYSATEGKGWLMALQIRGVRLLEQTAPETA